MPHVAAPGPRDLAGRPRWVLLGRPIGTRLTRHGWSVRLTAVPLALLLAVPGLAGPPPESEPIGVWPLHPEPAVLAGFAPPAVPWGRGHRGVDLAGHIGQPVRTALAGTVGFAGRIAGRGVVTVLHRDGTRTTYQPVIAGVGVGERLPRGGRIGRLALSGSHCFPRACLHWGRLRGEVYLDPLELVGGGPVRLLPLWRERPTLAAGWSGAGVGLAVGAP